MDVYDVNKNNFRFVFKFVFGMFVNFDEGNKFFVIFVKVVIIFKVDDDIYKYFEFFKYFIFI